jgi:hypothetical protein
MFLCFLAFSIADIMSKFSARFDAKAGKDAKGKGKANPPSSLSTGGTETIPGPADAATALPASGVKSSLGGKALAVSGVQGELKPTKRRDREFFKVEFMVIAFFLIYYLG